MVYARFQSFLEVGSIARRKLARKLADKLDEEALDAFKIARRLETSYTEEDIKRQFVLHRRAAVVKQLRRFGKLVDLAQLDAFADPIGEEAADWYRQGVLLLDAAERIRTHVALYEGYAAMRREDEHGTIAWGYLITYLRRWGIEDKDLAALLTNAGFVHDDAQNVSSLTDTIRKHRERRENPPRKRRRRRS